MHVASQSMRPVSGEERFHRKRRMEAKAKINLLSKGGKGSYYEVSAQNKVMSGVYKPLRYRRNILLMFCFLVQLAVPGSGWYGQFLSVLPGYLFDSIVHFFFL
jgi:hypothetical protein